MSRVHIRPANNYKWFKSCGEWGVWIQEQLQVSPAKQNLSHMTSSSPPPDLEGQAIKHRGEERYAAIRPLNIKIAAGKIEEELICHNWTTNVEVSSSWKNTQWLPVLWSVLEILHVFFHDRWPWCPHTNPMTLMTLCTEPLQWHTQTLLGRSREVRSFWCLGRPQSAVSFLMLRHYSTDEQWWKLRPSDLLVLCSLWPLPKLPKRPGRSPLPPASAGDAETQFLGSAWQQFSMALLTSDLSAWSVQLSILLGMSGLRNKSSSPALPHCWEQSVLTFRTVVQAQRTDW